MAQGKRSSASEVLDVLKRRCADEDLLLENVEEIFTDAKTELAKLIKTRKFKRFLVACLFSELKEQLIETKLLDLLDDGDKDYILTRAVKQVLKIKE